MSDALKLMCVLAHPDDESLGNGGILAKYAAEGIKTYLVTATRGERGWFGDEREYPGPEALGKLRENELLDAAEPLDIGYVDFLDYIDGTKRSLTTWPNWLVTTRIDAWKYWRTVSRAISCHRTQLPAYHVLEQISEEQRKTLWGTQCYYRAFSLVNGGRQVEEDMFEGLR